ncbi:precorrin-6A reductase (plasmid) [Rhizobium etli 8C-3]|uniref:Precorrin-6A/cobalt-precorrin-6A reductase n=2 Tax=Rhizobium TaxID=379 RepID=A0A4V2VBD4_9HYPH|nr:MULTISPECIES: cobalt-precorrin-6A reductase [Rhizobium]APO78726.1 precorrin-6A reductase [Rhizobium etli 8C-3]TCU24485.1 precorrin-6A/cobalt-precorrin-6A reductase [Rhizobium azibense]TCU39233.1 precorrin-6A/cobalt-precorrin-6A reductase [Rhizobium azibense]
MAKIRVLILGGTSEARALAQMLSKRAGFDILLSLAGRTEKPSVQPVPVRIGGFGGVEGLASFLRDGRFDILVDATHPFAARISANAVAAARLSGIAALALHRPEWIERPGDKWTASSNIAQAIAALGPVPRRVFLAIGRQEAHYAEAAAHHFYLVRSVDPVTPPLDIENAEYILDRGPFDVDAEAALFASHRIDAIVAKNSGGASTYAKIAAARHLGIEVFMIARAPAPAMRAVETVEEALGAIDQLFPPAIERGV